jgi:putative nucleotidyltransferase with HDIG domain
MTEKERLFQEIDRILMDEENPSLALKQMSRDPMFREKPFRVLDRLKQTGQSKRHHPEGNVWNHTLLVVDEAAKRKSESVDEAVFMWAALLHDIGKPDTTRERGGRFTAYGHDELGSRLAGEFLREFGCDEFFIRKVVGLIRWHMQILFVVKEMPFADINAMKRETDVEEVALLGLCDRLGRIGADRAEEERKIGLFLQKCGIEQI